MPWHQEPKKVVISCDKPRGAAHKRYIRGSLNGATRQRANAEEAKPKVARSSGFGQASRERTDSGTVWEGRRDRVRAPYTKSVLSSLDPEYHGAREIPWEYGGTTLQA